MEIPVAVATPVTVSPAVTSTTSIFHDVAVPLAQLKSAVVVVIFDAASVEGGIQDGASSKETSSIAKSSSKSLGFKISEKVNLACAGPVNVKPAISIIFNSQPTVFVL